MTILYLTHRLPYAPNRGDRVRCFHLLRHLGTFAHVDVVSLVHDEAELAQVSTLEPLVRSVRVARVNKAQNLLRSAFGLATSRPTTHSMLASRELQGALDATVRATPPDVVVASSSGVVPAVFAAPIDRVPFVLDMMDVDSAKWQALADVAWPPLSWVYRRESRVLGQFEATVAHAANATLVVSERERDTLAGLAPGAPTHVIPLGVDLQTLAPQTPPSDAASAVFCGVMNYPPNEHAALWLGRDIWPLVRRRRPDAVLTIVGSSPTPAVQSLASAERGIVVTGAVPDVRPYLWQAAVAVAPILTARGVQNKVLESVAAGLPTVTTPTVAAALPTAIRPGVMTAASAEAIADAVLAVMAMAPAERRAMTSRADLPALAWPNTLAPVRALLERAVTEGRRPREGQVNA